MRAELDEFIEEQGLPPGGCSSKSFMQSALHGNRYAMRLVGRKCRLPYLAFSPVLQASCPQRMTLYGQGGMTLRELWSAGEGCTR